MPAVPCTDAVKLCPHLKPLLHDLGLERFRSALDARRVTLTRLRTGASRVQDLKASGMSADEATALLLLATSSKSGWTRAPTRAQSTLEWSSLLRSFDVGLEHLAGPFANSCLRAQSLALNLLTEAQLVGAGASAEDAARLHRCARIYQAAASRLATDLLTRRAEAATHMCDCRAAGSRAAENMSAGKSNPACTGDFSGHGSNHVLFL